MSNFYGDMSNYQDTIRYFRPRPIFQDEQGQVYPVHNPFVPGQDSANIFKVNVHQNWQMGEMVNGNIDMFTPAWADMTVLFNFLNANTPNSPYSGGQWLSDGNFVFNNGARPSQNGGAPVQGNNGMSMPAWMNSILNPEVPKQPQGNAFITAIQTLQKALRSDEDGKLSAAEIKEQAEKAVEEKQPYAGVLQALVYEAVSKELDYDALQDMIKEKVDNSQASEETKKTFEIMMKLEDGLRDASLDEDEDGSIDTAKLEGLLNASTDETEKKILKGLIELNKKAEEKQGSGLVLNDLAQIIQGLTQGYSFEQMQKAVDEAIKAKEVENEKPEEEVKKDPEKKPQTKATEKKQEIPAKDSTEVDYEQVLKEIIEENKANSDSLDLNEVEIKKDSLNPDSLKVEPIIVKDSLDLNEVEIKKDSLNPDSLKVEPIIVKDSLDLNEIEIKKDSLNTDSLTVEPIIDSLNVEKDTANNSVIPIENMVPDSLTSLENLNSGQELTILIDDKSIKGTVEFDKEGKKIVEVKTDDGEIHFYFDYKEDGSVKQAGVKKYDKEGNLVENTVDAKEETQVLDSIDGFKDLDAGAEVEMTILGKKLKGKVITEVNDKKALQVQIEGGKDVYFFEYDEQGKVKEIDKHSYLDVDKDDSDKVMLRAPQLDIHPENGFCGVYEYDREGNLINDNTTKESESEKTTSTASQETKSSLMYDGKMTQKELDALNEKKQKELELKRITNKVNLSDEQISKALKQGQEKAKAKDDIVAQLTKKVDSLTKPLIEKVEARIKRSELSRENNFDEKSIYFGKNNMNYFDKDNNRIKTEFYYSSGAKKTYLYDYDEQGRMINRTLIREKASTYDSDGDLKIYPKSIDIISREYNEDGSFTKIVKSNTNYKELYFDNILEVHLRDIYGEFIPDTDIYNSKIREKIAKDNGIEDIDNIQDFKEIRLTSDKDYYGFKTKKEKKVEFAKTAPEGFDNPDKIKFDCISTSEGQTLSEYIASLYKLKNAYAVGKISDAILEANKLDPKKIQNDITKFYLPDAQWANNKIAQWISHSKRVEQINKANAEYAKLNDLQKGWKWLWGNLDKARHPQIEKPIAVKRDGDALIEYYETPESKAADTYAKKVITYPDGKKQVCENTDFTNKIWEQMLETFPSGTVRAYINTDDSNDSWEKVSTLYRNGDREYKKWNFETEEWDKISQKEYRKIK